MFRERQKYKNFILYMHMILLFKSILVKTFQTHEKWSKLASVNHITE